MVCPPPIGKGASSSARERSSWGTNSWRGTSAMAASTVASVIPRRRNCFSIISVRCGPYFSLSSMRNHRRVFFPGAGSENFLHLRESKIAFFLSIVEMRGNAHPSLGPVVHKNVAREEFAAHLASVRAFDGNRSCPLRGIFRSVDTPAARLRAFDEPRGHTDRFFANGCDPNFVKDVQPRLAGVERRYVRCAIQVAERVFAGINSAGFKRKGPAVRNPAGERRSQLRAQVFADVEISYARAAAQPFQRTANGKIGAQFSHLKRNGSGGLKGIENHVRPDAVRPLNDRASVNNIRAAEKHLRNWDEQRGFVDGREQLVQINTNVVQSRNNFDAGAVAPLLVIEILDRGEFELHHHNLVAGAAQVKTRSNHCLRESDVLMQRNLAGAGADQRRDLVAHRDRHFPPAFFPGAYSALRPGIGIGAHAVIYAPRHRAKRVADHVCGAVEDREFAAPLQKFIHRMILPRESSGGGPFSTQSSTP